MASPSISAARAESGARRRAAAALVCRRRRNWTRLARSASSAWAIARPSSRSAAESALCEAASARAAAAPPLRTLLWREIRASDSQLPSDATEARIGDEESTQARSRPSNSAAIAATHEPYASSHSCSSRQKVGEKPQLFRVSRSSRGPMSTSRRSTRRAWAGWRVSSNIWPYCTLPENTSRVSTPAREWSSRGGASCAAS
eukprot:scaffold7204_cov102-Isochrysis_galbana.AAC.5